LFKGIPLTDYNEKTIEFLSTSFTNIKIRNSSISEKDKKELLDYDLLWNIIMSKCDHNIDPLLKNNSMNCLLKLIIDDHNIIEKYIYISIDLITNNADSILYAMNYLKSILYESKNKNIYLHMLKINIFNKVFHSLIQYKQKVIELVEKNNYKGDIMVKVSFVNDLI